MATNWLTGVHRHRGRARHEHAALPGPGRSLLFRVVPVRIHADLLRLPVVAHPASEKHSQVRWVREGPGCCRAGIEGQGGHGDRALGSRAGAGPVVGAGRSAAGGAVGRCRAPESRRLVRPNSLRTVPGARCSKTRTRSGWSVIEASPSAKLRSTRRPTVTSGRARNCGDYGTSVVGPRYNVTASRDHEVSAGNAIVPVSEQSATGPDGKKIVVWSLYTVDGRPNPMRLPDQLAYGVRSLVGAPPASVIALAAECRPDCEHARTALGSLAAQALPMMLAAAPGPN